MKKFKKEKYVYVYSWNENFNLNGLSDSESHLISIHGSVRRAARHYTHHIINILNLLFMATACISKLVERLCC